MNFRIDTPSKIFIDKSPIHGWGVFAKVDIEENEIIEECPILTLPIEKGESRHTYSTFGMIFIS
jgi:SET domain-containing protein